MRSVKVITLGCSKNRVDSEHLMRQLQAASFEIVPEDGNRPVDTVVLNTCAFIQDAKEESIAAIFDAIDRKNRGEVSHVYVFGCLSQRYGAELRGMIPEVDGFFGASGSHRCLFYGAGQRNCHLPGEKCAALACEQQRRDRRGVQFYLGRLLCTSGWPYL